MTIFNWIVYINLYFGMFVVITFCIPCIWREISRMPVFFTFVLFVFSVEILFFGGTFGFAFAEGLIKDPTDGLLLFLNFLPTIIIFSLGIYLYIRQRKLSKWLKSLNKKICIFYDELEINNIKYGKIGRVGLVTYGPFILYMYYDSGTWQETLSLKKFKQLFSHIATEDEYKIKMKKNGFGGFYEKITIKKRVLEDNS